MAFDSLTPAVAYARGGRVKKARAKKAKTNIKAQNIVTQVVKVNVGAEAKARKRKAPQKRVKVVQEAPPSFGYRSNPNYPAPGPQVPFIIQSPSAPGANITISNLPGTTLTRADLQEAMQSIRPNPSSWVMPQDNPAIADKATFARPAEVLKPVPVNVNIDKPSIEAGGNLRTVEHTLKGDKSMVTEMDEKMKQLEALKLQEAMMKSYQTPISSSNQPGASAAASASAKLEEAFPRLTSMMPKKSMIPEEEERAYAQSAAASAPLPKIPSLITSMPGEPERIALGKKAVQRAKERQRMELEDERATALREAKKKNLKI